MRQANHAERVAAEAGRHGGSIRRRESRERMAVGEMRHHTRVTLPSSARLCVDDPCRETVRNKQYPHYSGGRWCVRTELDSRPSETLSEVPRLKRAQDLEHGRIGRTDDARSGPERADFRLSGMVLKRRFNLWTQDQCAFHHAFLQSRPLFRARRASTSATARPPVPWNTSPITSSNPDCSEHSGFILR